MDSILPFKSNAELKLKRVFLTGVDVFSEDPELGVVFESDQAALLDAVYLRLVGLGEGGMEGGREEGGGRTVIDTKLQPSSAQKKKKRGRKKALTRLTLPR